MPDHPTLPLRPLALKQLSAWNAGAHYAALEAFQRSAREILESGSGFHRAPLFGGRREDWTDVCREGLAATHAAEFFETAFTACEVFDAGFSGGLFTGYYEPVVEGSSEASPQYLVPVYRKPPDLVAFSPEETASAGVSYGRRTSTGPVAYDTRQAIECGSLSGLGLEICWLKDWVDAFFMHIQGSGRVCLAGGGEIRLSYAAKSGRPYQSIGAILVQRGAMKPDAVSMQSLRSWMKANPKAARALMWENPSYVFFREQEVVDPALGAMGAAKVNLTPRRSLAVDRSYWQFGTPMWLETQTPAEDPNGRQPFCQLMIAQDTGSAIKGLARGDVYWGWGEEAAQIAGHMKSQGRIIALLPKPVARRLGIEP